MYIMKSSETKDSFQCQALHWLGIEMSISAKWQFLDQLQTKFQFINELEYNYRVHHQQLRWPGW